MSDEKSQQQTSTESTVAGAAKTGKAISNIAKGAAAGGAHGAAIEAGKSSAKWLIPLIATVLLPLILVAMLPSIIFGSLLGDGTDSPNGISNDEVLKPKKTAQKKRRSSLMKHGNLLETMIPITQTTPRPLQASGFRRFSRSFVATAVRPLLPPRILATLIEADSAKAS